MRSYSIRSSLLLLLSLLLAVHSSESITILESILKFGLFEIAAHTYTTYVHTCYIIIVYTQGILYTYSYFYYSSVPLYICVMYRYTYYDVHIYNVLLWRCTKCKLVYAQVKTIVINNNVH